VTYRFALCIDANDPDLLQPFLTVALGCSEDVRPGQTIDLVDPRGHGPAVWFQRVPETKSIKNRVHLDIWLDSIEEADILRSSLADRRLHRRCAAPLRQPPRSRGERAVSQLTAWQCDRHDVRPRTFLRRSSQRSMRRQDLDQPTDVARMHTFLNPSIDEGTASQYS
jgi:hypothetical protein